MMELFTSKEVELDFEALEFKGSHQVQSLGQQSAAEDAEEE